MFAPLPDGFAHIFEESRIMLAALATDSTLLRT
jgi:hypothetical protein